jgi:hypothetical protein
MMGCKTDQGCKTDGIIYSGAQVVTHFSISQRSSGGRGGDRRPPDFILNDVDGQNYRDRLCIGKLSAPL